MALPADHCVAALKWDTPFDAFDDFADLCAELGPECPPAHVRASLIDASAQQTGASTSDMHEAGQADVARQAPAKRQRSLLQAKLTQKKFRERRKVAGLPPG